MAAGSDATTRERSRIAEGREAEIFAWGEGRVLRLMRGPAKREAVRALEFQRSALEAARAAGVRAPAPFESITVDGRPGLLMERIDGPDLMSVIASQPWKLGALASLAGRLHAQLHAVVAPPGIPDLKDTLRARMQSDLVPDSVARFAHDALADLPDGDRLFHGDFHPGNVLEAGGEHFVIDWAGVARGDPDADYARTNLMLRLGDLPPGSPGHLRVFAALGRPLLLGAYRRGYRSERVPDEDAVRRWEVPLAAARLQDDIGLERPRLLKLLARRLHSSGS